MNRSIVNYLFRPRSLGSRLSRSLAVQTLVGLAVVSLFVYAMIAQHLRADQTSSMDRLEAFVEHLVEEAKESGDADALDHMLEDFMIGHEDLSLELSSREGSVIYGVPEAKPATEEWRTIAFTLPEPNKQRSSGGVSARLSINTADDDALLARLAWTLVATSLLGAVAGSLGAAWRVRRGLLPLANLDRQLRALDASNLEHRLSDAGQPSELQPLVARFNELLRRLDGAYRELEGYNANVAHELKTPLATLVSNCELGLRGSYDPPALRELLGSNLEELERLAGVVRSMLFLSTVERGSRAHTESIPSLAALAADVVEYHEAVLEEADLKLRIDGDAAANGNVMLLRQAVSNLLSNATRHATSGSDIRIVIDQINPLARVSPVREPSDTDPTIATGHQQISFAVINTGETISVEHLGKLFDRFYRVESNQEMEAHDTTVDVMRTATPRRHGLGLPIVSAIARMHGGKTFALSVDQLTTVGFLLPASSVSHSSNPDSLRTSGAGSTPAPMLMPEPNTQ